MTPAYAHILVIDANRSRSRRITRPFSDWGWRATWVDADAAAAIAAAGAGAADVDLVLIEITAAERDDHAILRAWAARPALWAIPVVVTAPPKTHLDRLARCISLGASDYLTHPFNPVLLRARVQNSLQKRLLIEQAGEALRSFNELEKLADDLRMTVLPISAALLAEPSYEGLLSRIVGEARAICGADCGILFLADEAGTLRPAYAQVASLGLDLSEATTGSGQIGSGQTGNGGNSLAALEINEEDANGQSLGRLALRAAFEGDAANVADIRNEGHFDLSNLAPLEARFGYAVSSALVVPLRSGSILGALLLINSIDPRTGAIVPFDVYHQMVAESLASQAAIVLNNRLLTERQLELTRYKQELEIARVIQQSFLPAHTPRPRGWEVAARFRPAFEVAGDFYDFVPLPESSIALVISDVVGKGVTAAMYMAIIRSLFRALLGQQHQPAAAARPTPTADAGELLLNAFRMTNDYLSTTHQDNHVFATLFCAVLDPATGRLLYVNAGHNPPYVLRASAAATTTNLERLPTTGPALGLIPAARYSLGELWLEPGETLLAFTDGVPDARDPGGRPLGSAAFEAMLCYKKDTNALLDAILELVRDFTAGAEPYDDISMFAVRRLPLA